MKQSLTALVCSRGFPAVAVQWSPCSSPASQVSVGAAFALLGWTSERCSGTRAAVATEAPWFPGYLNNDGRQ